MFDHYRIVFLEHLFPIVSFGQDELLTRVEADLVRVFHLSLETACRGLSEKWHCVCTGSPSKCGVGEATFCCRGAPGKVSVSRARHHWFLFLSDVEEVLDCLDCETLFIILRRNHGPPIVEIYSLSFLHLADQTMVVWDLVKDEPYHRTE